MDVEKEFKRKGTISKRVTFPLLFWEEFEQDCKDNFNDTYFLKIQHNHEFVKSFQTIVSLLMEDILELKREVVELKHTPQTEEDSKKGGKTFSRAA